MRYKHCVDKILNIEGLGEYEIICPEELENGEYYMEYSATLEFAQINGSPYGWFIGEYPVLRKETDHGIYVEEFDELTSALETSSFWVVEIYD